MNHLDEGTLLAVRDEETQDEHLSHCSLCRESLADLGSRRDVVAGALAILDSPSDLETARARIRERLTVQSAEKAGAVPLTTRPRRAVWGLSRAAGLLLVTAAGLSALPGSPARAWIANLLGPTTPEERTEAISAPATELTSGEREDAGIRLAVPRGPLQVVVLGAEPGAEIRVRWVPGADAAVFAPVGSRFTTGAGRLEARVTSGGVRVELPRGVVPVSLEVGGRIYLRSTDAGLDVPGPVVERSASEIVFRIP